MKKIFLITGGQRSGKSNYGEKLALSLSSNPIYLATSRIWDDEHKNRIDIHKKNRTSEWTTIEEEKNISNHNLENKVILIDCVTLWATNFFFDLNSDVQKTVTAIKEEFDKFTNQNATFIFITNEIGMGEMSQNKIQRKFSDTQGFINQYISNIADEVIFMVSGIALKIK